MKSKEFLHTLKIFALGVIGCLLIQAVSFLIVCYPFFENKPIGDFMRLISLAVQAVGCGFFGAALAKLSFKQMPLESAQRKLPTYKFVAAILILLMAVYIFNIEIYWRLFDLVIYAGLSPQEAQEAHILTAPMIKQLVLSNVITPLALPCHIACTVVYGVFMSKQVKNRSEGKEVLKCPT